MIDEPVEDLIVKSDKLDASLADVAISGREGRKILKRTNWLMAIMLVLILAMGGVTAQSFHTSKQAQTLADSNYNVCTATNAQNAEITSLWDLFYASSTPTEQTTNKNLISYINTTYGSRICVRGASVSVIEFTSPVVENHLLGIGGPALALNQRINLVTSRCVAGNVAVYGTVRWDEISPHHDVQVPFYGKEKTLPSGCHIVNFSFQMPSSVTLLSQEAFRSGAHATLWRIEASLVPVLSNQRVETWASQTFEIVP